MPSRWTAASDRDYDDEPWVPVDVQVTCVSCHREFFTREDDRPPFRCAACCESDAIRQELGESQADVA